MKERRGGHIGTISGLALLTGTTALAAVAGGQHSIFATMLLGLLSLGMAHSLFVEIRRQARRRATWSRHDTVNTVVLAAFGETALLITIIAGNPEPVRTVGPILSLTYAAACARFVTDRRRAIATAQPTPAHSDQRRARSDEDRGRAATPTRL
ncbi:hypothetical protein [Actinoplanes sp. NPDC051411]|uniref:hypothetical protein n=1 Tax=Actinoplanes sp. NPDC051411 TaxID=3155522 RepID=UPI003420F52C